MPNSFNTCDVVQDALTDQEVIDGWMPPQPKIYREITTPVVLSTSFQRLDLSVNNANTFTNGLGGKKLVDWDATNKLFTFNDTTTRNYIAALNLKLTTSGVLVTPIVAPVYVQFRFVVPDGVSPGVDYYFPFSTGDGFMDLQEVAFNGTRRHQRLTPVTSDANKRATGVGCEVRTSALTLTGSLTVAAFSVYLFGA